MAAGKSSRINRQYKTKYRIRDWREYERGLRSRGDVTIWLSEDAIAAWIPPKNGLRGGQRRYSNLAIRTALTLRVVFGLPLRQTEGFLDSLLSLMSRDLKAPDPTTLSRRNQIVVVPPLTRAHDGPGACDTPRQARDDSKLTADFRKLLEAGQHPLVHHQRVDPIAAGRDQLRSGESSFAGQPKKVLSRRESLQRLSLIDTDHFGED